MRWLAQLALALTGLLLVSWLIGNTTLARLPTETVPAVGGTYTEAVIGPIRVLHPLLAVTSQAEVDAAALVFSGLTRRDEKGTIVPDLAERWEISADGRFYTFFLRRGVRWHDGQAFTAQDVAFTVQATQDPDGCIPPSLAHFWEGVSVERLGELIIRFGLPEPYAPFFDYTAIGIIPSHALGSGAEARETFLSHAIGTGPYKVREQTAAAVVLDAFEGYYGPRRYIQRVVLRSYPDRQSALAALRSGAVDGVGGLTSEDVAGLAGADVAIYRAKRAALELVYLNVRLPYLAERDVRRALLLAIDRRGMVDHILKGYALVANGPLLSGSWAEAKGSDVTLPGYDPDQAAALLDAAGWRMGAGGREKGGTRLELTLVTNDDPERIAMAEEIAHAWTAVGVRTEVQAVGVASLIRDYVVPRSFDALLYGWEALPADPDPYEFWHSSQRGEGGLNFSGLANNRMDEVLEQARQTTDQDVRQRLYQRFQELFVYELPALPLVQPYYIYAISTRVRGVTIGYISDPSDRFRSMATWYVQTKTVPITSSP